MRQVPARRLDMKKEQARGVLVGFIIQWGMERRLEVEKFIVYIQSKVPVNDGGISLGQTAIAQELILNNMGAPKYLNFEVN